MRPSPIEASEVPPGFARRVFSAPNGDLTDKEIAPLEVVFGPLDDSMVFASKWKFEEGDLEEIQRTGHLWVVVQGLQPVLALTAGDLTK